MAWLGSGFDCGCECAFEAGFTYNGIEPSNWGQDPPPICMLLFSVGNAKNGCEAIDLSTADLTVVLKRNGTVIAEPMTYSADTSAFYWERWEPVAGDVFTATVTLNCGDGDVVRDYSFTIPTPANTTCVCCNDRTPDFITVSGLTGSCCSLANGTFAVALRPGGSTCIYDGEATFADPGDCSTYCYTCSTAFATFFFSVKRVRVTVGIGRDPITLGFTPNPDTIVIFIDIEFWVYRLRTVFGELTCDRWTSGVPGPDCANGPSQWRMTSLCNSGAMTFTTTPGFGAICISQTPTVRVHFQ